MRKWSLATAVVLFFAVVFPMMMSETAKASIPYVGGAVPGTIQRSRV
ncbi:MAG: hypothetical protein ACE5QF_01220 [Thermoplasmata archaeon]